MERRLHNSEVWLIPSWRDCEKSTEAIVIERNEPIKENRIIGVWQFNEGLNLAVG